KFTKEEILGFVNERKENPANFKLGTGDDAMTMSYRAEGDTNPPVMYAGAAGAIEEEEFVPLMISFAREKKIKGMGISGGIMKVGDVVPKAGTLSEVHCALWEQERLEEVLQEVGRPGMCLGLLCTASTIGATMQCLDRGFRGPHNTHIGVHVIPEQKIDWDRLILSHFCKDRGIVPWQSAMCLIGGLCRDAADAAVGLIANVLGHMSFA
ncbi:MAG: monomethylamine:corrinoid methyltransferase, partial [bacterium]|nr:monomethylamine:corrinoid methyltransferase [bacterium]